LKDGINECSLVGGFGFPGRYQHVKGMIAVGIKLWGIFSTQIVLIWCAGYPLKERKAIQIQG